MPNKRGRPPTGKPRKPPKPQIAFKLTLETQEQLEDIKRWGGSSWIRQKWQERKLVEEKESRMIKPYVPTQEQLDKMRRLHAPSDKEGRSVIGHLLNTIQDMKNFIDKQ